MNIIRIRCYGPVSDSSTPIDGSYLQAFDVEAYGGRGHVEFTNDPEQAMGFFTIGDAMQAWYSQSRVRPIRADGRRNMPLTAFSAEFVSEPLRKEDA